MEIQVIQHDKAKFAVVSGDEYVIRDLQSGLDLLADARAGYGCQGLIVPRACIVPEFFQLSTRLAGDILQKFINYHMKLAIVGDFSGETSESLQAFIRESNRGADIFFTATQQEAVERLGQCV